MPSPIFLGASAILAHQDWLNVIGNNIANINTFGFKGSRMRFGDIIGSAVGGVTIGSGVSVAGVDANFNQSALQGTGQDLDVALSGNGFFILNDGNQNLFTRAGALNVDSSKFLIEQSSGFRVQDTQGNDIKIDPKSFEVIGSPTTQVDLVGNLDPSTPAAGSFKTSITVFDSDGKSHTLNLQYTKKSLNATPPDAKPVGVPASVNDWWDMTATSPEGSIFGTGGGGASDISITGINFKADGSFNGTATGDNGTPGGGGGPGGANGVPDLIADFGLGDQIVDLSFTDTSSISGAGNLREGSKNGKRATFFDSVTITETGELKAVKTDGSTETITSLGIALFDNQGGLKPEGNSIYSATNTSGGLKIVRPTEQGAGVIRSGVLETSNVDMTTELVNLIVAQRGFSMGARVVQTADQVLQETLTLKR